MKVLAICLLAMAVAANVQAVTQPYVIPIYRVTKDPTTAASTTTTAATTTDTAATTTTTAATTTDTAATTTDTAATTTDTAATTTATAPPSLMDKFSYFLETRQGRHPRSLVYDNKPRGVEGYSIEHVCSGTLVDNSAIITTITCIESAWRDTLFNPWVGTAHDTSSNDAPDKVFYEVEKHFAHPDYDSANNVNNIAVLKLATDVDFTQSGVGHITWALEIPAPKAKCVTSYWDAGTTFQQVNKDVTVETCTPEKEGAICSSFAPTLTECPSGSNGASLVCDSKVAGIFAPRRNSDCSATLWQYEELSKDAQWIWESVNAAPILNVSFAAILVLITTMIKNL